MMLALGMARKMLGGQHRGGSRRVEDEELLAALPGPFLDQLQVEAVLAEHQANEPRLRAERMMEQREHRVPR